MRYKTVPGTIITQICGKYFIVTSEETISVSETAYICLKCLEHGADPDKLCDVLGDQFEIDRKTLLSDIDSLINDLTGRRLLMRIA